MEELGQRQVLLTIEVDDERLERAMDQAYKRLVGRINVPGFRKGKAPRPLVERIVGREALLEEAIELLVPAVYREAIQAEGIKPAAQPRVEVVNVPPLQVRATIPLEPRVELGNYRLLALTPEPTEVGEDEVDRVVDELRASHAQWVPVERAARLGDRVGLDVRASVGDRVVIDSKEAEFVVDPDGPQPAPGFAHQLVGMAADESREFTLRLADDLSNKELAGQEARFEVHVHWVKERQLPALDDAFVSLLGEFESVEQLRSRIRQDLQRQKEESSLAKLEAEAIQQLVARSRVEVAPQMIEEEAEHVRERFVRNLDRRGITLEQYLRFAEKAEAEFRAELLSEAEQALRRAAVLSAMADAEGIQVADSEVDEEIRRMAENSPDSQRLIRNALARVETRERVRAALRERKAVRHLVDIATGRQELAPAASAATE